MRRYIARAVARNFKGHRKVRHLAQRGKLLGRVATVAAQ